MLPTTSPRKEVVKELLPPILCYLVKYMHICRVFSLALLLFSIPLRCIYLPYEYPHSSSIMNGLARI